jgi:hypothetical protein
MSRADSYGAYHRDFYPPLLHQTYAYCGNAEVAERSVADAFVSAGHHWRKLEHSADRDAWMREKAFRATGRAQNRARQPWFVSAQAVAESHRPLLGALAELEPTDRRLVIVAYLVGLDLSATAREAGVTDSAARTSLESSLARFADAGIDPSWAGLNTALTRLATDLVDEPAERPGRLRREGNRRRRSHLLLGGMTILAFAVAAGALTAAQSPAQSSGDDAAPTQAPATPTAPAEETFTAASLATPDDVRTLDEKSHWSTVITSSDFGDDKPVSECVAAPPSEKRADHYWVRRFAGGRADTAPQAAQSLEVAASAQTAKKTYDQLLDALSTCPEASRQLLSYRKVTGIGDRADLFTFRYVDGDDVRDELALISRTGTVVQTWVVRPQSDTVRSRQVLKVGASSVDAVCADADGACSTAPYEAVDAMPVSDGADGFLATVDLPVFGGIDPGWAATPVANVAKNPSATACDRADFEAGGADNVKSRTYVVPGSKKLPPVFGMTETVGAFPSVNAARSFVSGVYRTVDRCGDKQANLAVQREDEVHVGAANGRAWQIESAASETRSFVYRVCLLRVGDTVAEVTFTPSDAYDVDHASYVRLAQRAGQRLSQAD